jgi:hypothetical protein
MHAEPARLRIADHIPVARLNKAIFPGMHRPASQLPPRAMRIADEPAEPMPPKDARRFGQGFTRGLPKTGNAAEARHATRQPQLKGR